MRVKNKNTGKVYEVIGTCFDMEKGGAEGRIYLGDTDRRPVTDVTLREFMTEYEPVADLVVNFEPVAVSKLAGVEIASANYTEGEKEYFTFDEALKIQEQLKDTGWRLPTRKEWVLICEEFACNDNGELDAQLLADKLKLPRAGYVNGSNGSLGYVGTYGYYWSSTPGSSSGGYALYFRSDYVNPSYGAGSGNGYSVRLVRNLQAEEEND